MAKIGTMLSNLDSKGSKNGQLFIYGSLVDDWNVLCGAFFLKGNNSIIERIAQRRR
jgi:hypothetical protein